MGGDSESNGSNGDSEVSRRVVIGTGRGLDKRDRPAGMYVGSVAAFLEHAI